MRAAGEELFDGGERGLRAVAGVELVELLLGQQVDALAAPLVRLEAHKQTRTKLASERQRTLFEVQARYKIL